MALPFTPFPTLTYEGDVATSEGPSDCEESSDKKCAMSLIARDRRRNRWGPKSSWGKHWHDDSNSMSPPSAGDTATFSVMNGTIPQGSYVTFVSGLDVVSVQGTVKRERVPGPSFVPYITLTTQAGNEISATIPPEAEGQTYVFVTKNATTMIQASTVLYGPAILEVMPQPPMVGQSQ